MSEQPGRPTTPPRGDRRPPSATAGGAADSPVVRVGRGVAETSRWTLRLLVIGVGVAGLLWVLGRGWSLLLPLLLAVLLSAVLWPLAQLLRRWMPPALAALLTILVLAGVVVGIVLVLVPRVVDESGPVVDSAVQGLERVQQWVTDGPLGLGDDQVGTLIDQGIDEVQSNAQQIALGLVGGLGSLGAGLGSGVVTLLLVLVLTFFCLADGDSLLPWSRRWLDERTHRHATALGSRIWRALRGYILSQAAVALVDAVFIGLGLWIVGVPFAFPLAVMIFFAAFVPIVGAVITGVLATLVALVTLGWVQALVVLGIVLLVQQLEGNVLQPVLVGKTLALHPAVVIGSVTVGGTLFGITGAFLAVPLVAVITVTLRYVHHVLVPDDPETPGEDDGAKGGKDGRERKDDAERGAEDGGRVSSEPAAGPA